MKLLFENWRKFIKEDDATRETFAKEFCEVGGFESGYWGGMPTSRKDYQDAIKAGRPLKKLYNKHADRAFLNSLITVHWTERMGVIKILSKGSKDASPISLRYPRQFSIKSFIVLLLALG